MASSAEFGITLIRETIRYSIVSRNTLSVTQEVARGTRFALKCRLREGILDMI